MDTLADDLVIVASRWKAAKLLVLGAVFVACGAYLARRPEIFLNLIGLVGMIFFSLCSTYAIFRIARPGIAVLVDSQGVEDRASAVGVGRIRWDEIQSARVYDFQGQTMLGIVPRRLDEFIQGQPWWRRFALRANVKLGCDPINIPEILLPVSAHRVLEAIDRHIARRGPG